MLRVSNLRGFNRVPQTAMFQIVRGQALSRTNSGWQGFTLRSYMTVAAFPSAPSIVQFVRMILLGPSGGCDIGAMFIGVGAGGVGLNARALAPVTVGRATAFALEAGVQYSTDINQILWNKATPLMLTAYFAPAGRGNLSYEQGLVGGDPNMIFYYKPSANEAGQLVVNAADYTSTAIPTGVQCLAQQYEMGAG